MTDESIEYLSTEACWQKLKEAPFGRIAMAVAGVVEIFPINFIESGGALYFRTAPGTKLLALTVNSDVAIEVDSYTADEAWSVVVRGVAERVEKQSEIDIAETLALHPWMPTLKYRWVRVRPTQLTGRQFHRDPEPERF